MTANNKRPMKNQSYQIKWRCVFSHSACALLVLVIAPVLFAQQTPEIPSNKTVAAVAARNPAAAGSVLFIGNSFFYGYGSPVRFYHAQTVTDLNGDGVGGVPALFKSFADQARLKFAVSLETAGGKGLDFHVQNKAAIIARPWDYVVMQGYSTLNPRNPGDPDLLVRSAKQMAELLHGRNPAVDIRLVATWSRADQVYPESGHWHGQPIEAMARDVRSACDLAVAGTPFIQGVVPVGEAWNRAIKAGVADPNPYDGIAPGQMNLWTSDNHHASTFGYYLEALMIFGDLTGLDPRSLGNKERSAFELGLSPAQAGALQQVAFDELMAANHHPSLKEFTPMTFPRRAEGQAALSGSVNVIAAGNP